MLTPVFGLQGNLLKKMHPGEILYFKTAGNYTTFFLLDGTTVIVRATLSDAIKKLPRDMFIKVHRGYAVSVFHIDKITNDDLHVGRKVVVIGRKEIQIAKQFYRAAIKQLIVIGRTE
jgi:DNA-binding LytR/AlgR family response regulator